MKRQVTCFRCDSERVVKGRIIGYRGHKPLFLPDHSKFLKLALTNPYLKIEYESYVCVECGLFWSITDDQETKKKIKKWGKKVLKDRLCL